MKKTGGGGGGGVVCTAQIKQVARKVEGFGRWRAREV
jgi:hypothetical protein